MTTVQGPASSENDSRCLNVGKLRLIHYKYGTSFRQFAQSQSCPGSPQHASELSTKLSTLSVELPNDDPICTDEHSCSLLCCCGFCSDAGMPANSKSAEFDRLTITRHTVTTASLAPCFLPFVWVNAILKKKLPPDYA